MANDSFNKISLYADKPLNQKIASSILPVHSGSFFGGWFRFLAMLASLLMPLFFVTGWLLYLKRRQQKRLTLQARTRLGSTVSTDAAWSIFFATQTGTAEQLAYDTAQQFNKANISCRVTPLSDCTVEQLIKQEKVLFIVSTYGSGDAPDAAAQFVKYQLSQHPDLSHLRFALLALGSQDYADTFCGFGAKLNQWLIDSHATPLFDWIKVSDGNSQSILQWYKSLAQVLGQDLSVTLPTKVFTKWHMVKRQCINKGSLGEPVYQLYLQPQGAVVSQTGNALVELSATPDEMAVSWQAGDIVEVLCGNSAERLQHFAQQYGLPTNVMADFIYRDLIHVPIDWDKKAEHLDLLPTREYSIASLPEEGEVQLLIRQKHVDGGLGLGSGWMTQYAPQDNDILMHIRSNPSFHLLNNEAPAIFIANGTGLAGVLSLIKQRCSQHQIQNWLLFGERQQQYDFFCSNQIQAWQQQGMLRHVDCAFSRDQHTKVYVQDLLIQQAQRLQQWVEQGAVIYVCGSLQGMAAGVDKALRQVLGDQQLEQLKMQQRYKRDVY